MPRSMLNGPYGRSRWARDGCTDSSDWLRKWNGVVEDASK